MSRWKISTTTFDDLTFMTEEEIAQRISECRSEINKQGIDYGWRERWEVELCYAQRELQIRHGRRRAHHEYTLRINEEDLRELQAYGSLPEYEGNRIPKYVREALQWS